MASMIRAKRIVRLSRVIGDTAYFSQPEGYVLFQWHIRDWRAMGEPTELTLTIEPGDHLNVAQPDTLPHSRACGITKHEHGDGCAPDCPTCSMQAIAGQKLAD